MNHDTILKSLVFYSLREGETRFVHTSINWSSYYLMLSVALRPMLYCTLHLFFSSSTEEIFIPTQCHAADNAPTFLSSYPLTS